MADPATIHSALEIVTVLATIATASAALLANRAAILRRALSVS